MHSFKIGELSLVLKLSEICNLACSYCYYYQDDLKGEWRRRPRFLSEDIFATFADRLADFVTANPIERLTVTLHGGEPTLLDPGVVDFICKYLRLSIPDTIDISFKIQTNGLYLSRAWMRTLHRNAIALGVSLDGPPEVNDASRVTSSGRPSSPQVEATLRKWREFSAGEPWGGFGVIAVADPSTNVAEAVEYFVGDLGASGINFLLRNPEPESLADDTAMAVVLKAIFTASLVDKRVLVRELVAFYRAIRNTPVRPSAVEGSRIFYPAITLVLYTDGTVFVDDAIAAIREWSSTAPRMNVASQSVQEYLSMPEILTFHEASNRSPAACASCKFSDVCRGGPPNFRYSAERGFDNRSRYCSSYYQLYEFVGAQLQEAGLPPERLSLAHTRN